MKYEIGSDVKDVDGKTVRARCGSFSNAKELCDGLAHRHTYDFWVFDTKLRKVVYSQSGKVLV